MAFGCTLFPSSARMRATVTANKELVIPSSQTLRGTIWPGVDMNLLELAEEEHRLVREGVALHGDFYENAAGTTVAFSNLVGHPVADCEAFLRFHAKAKKHHTLAVLSAVRRHRAQA